MKRIATVFLLAAVTASGFALAQSDNMKDCEDMKGMDMKGMDMKGMDMKDMKGMDMKSCKEMMKDKNSGGKVANAAAVHKASALVEKVDPASKKVTLAHEPIKSLNWPAMTMGFVVKDKSLFRKLKVGKKVEVEIAKQGSDYVVMSVK